jgi:hypothetical protein
MIKIILAAAFLSFAMFAPSKANPISAVTTMSQSSALDVVKIQRREGRGRKRGLRNRGYRPSVVLPVKRRRQSQETGHQPPGMMSLFYARAENSPFGLKRTR